MKLLTREEFKEWVLARSKGKCIFCQSDAVDAHHIIERKLFPDGGYYLDNGAAVCAKHHLDCETTLISVEEVRTFAGIKNIVLPNGFDAALTYDKWGNEILEPSRRKPGPLFNDEGVQKILKSTGMIRLFW